MIANLNDPFQYYLDICDLCNFQKISRPAFVTRMDKIIEYAEEMAIVNIVAEFERIVFDHFGIASDNIVDFVKNHYPNSNPMYDFRESFVKKRKTDIHHLSDIKEKFIMSYDTTLAEDLLEILQHRNYLAHGKRNDKGVEHNFTAQDVKTKLESILAIL